jgi:FAD/FMN-containing dehydrogenase
VTDSSSSGTRPQSNRGGSVSVDSARVTEDQPGPGGAVSASPAELLARAAEALPAGVRQAHEAAVAAIQQAYAAVPPGAKVRLAKRTSNLFRFRDQSPESQAGELDVSAFSRVLHVDPASRTAVVGGMTTYEDLADATLAHGLMPFVVPQLKTITLGGAVTGLGIESTSLRLGMPHESVLAMEILTGDGQVVTDRAGAGGAVRAPAALPLRRP